MNQVPKRLKLLVVETLMLTFLLSATCIAAPAAPAAAKLDKAKYPRIGLLVSRMGGAGFTSPLDITLQTSYAVSAPAGKTAKDSYLEDETRLKGLSPEYPLLYLEKRGGIFAFYSEQKYYKNITAAVYRSVGGLLAEKGYQVVDVREASRGWAKPLADMTIEQIAAALKGTVDALFVLHYTDYGDAVYDDQHSRKITRGFPALAFKAAAFDLATGERLLAAFPKHRINLYTLLQNDPEIKADPILSKKIRTLDSASADLPFTFGYWLRTRSSLVSASAQAVIFDLSEDEILAYALKYMRKGYKDYAWNETLAGLEKYLP